MTIFIYQLLNTCLSEIFVHFGIAQNGTKRLGHITDDSLIRRYELPKRTRVKLARTRSRYERSNSFWETLFANYQEAFSAEVRPLTHK